MQFVLVVHGHVVAQLHGVVARPLAARHAHAAGGCAQVGTGPAQIEAGVRQILEGGLELVGGGAQQNDVAGRAVHVGQAGPVLFPDVADRAQRVAGVEPSGGMVDAHGVEVGDFRELLREGRCSGRSRRRRIPALPPVRHVSNVPSSPCRRVPAVPADLWAHRWFRRLA